MLQQQCLHMQLTAYARETPRSCSLSKLQSELAHQASYHPTLTMLRKVLQHHCRLRMRNVATACCPFEVGASTSLASTPRKETVVVRVLQPMISLQAGHNLFSSFQASHQACWQCGCKLDSSSLFFCPKCRAILPSHAAQADLFRVMGLPGPTYDVDLRQLEGEYKRLQKDLHPDKFGGRGAREQEYSAEQSSLVNRAYTLLRNPLQRALYLLERRGVPVPEDGGTISDPQLLMEVMEQREQIEETDDPVQLQTMLQENRLLQQATTEKLSAAFASDDLKHAERVITDLRYVTRTGEAIAKKIPGG